MQNEALIKKIFEKLAARSQTLALAESCTGGLVSSQLARLPGISKIFNGAVVSYANQVKSDILGVPEEWILKVGAVSPEVALKMAEGARDKLKSSWAVGITGIAGPTGGSEAKPVGTVCFAVVGPGVALVENAFFEGNRTEIQEKSALFALNLLWRHLDV